MKYSRLKRHSHLNTSLQKRHLPYYRMIASGLVITGIGFLGYGGYTVVNASQNTQHIMVQSKSLKEVYGQDKQAQQERQNRNQFDKLYNHYMRKDNSTLKHLDKGISIKDVSKLNDLAQKTGIYYKDSYVDKANNLKLIASVQNDYLKLWAHNKVDKELKSGVQPKMIYEFNNNHYNDLQLILTYNANSQYPQWMIGRMQILGQDAANVEHFVHDFASYYVFPTTKSSWYVEHTFKSADKNSLLAEYKKIKFKWRAISFMPDILRASGTAALKNEEMQKKLDHANAVISSIKAAEIASSEAKAASESAASSRSESIKQSSIDSERESSERVESEKNASIQSQKDAESKAESEKAAASSKSEADAKAKSESAASESSAKAEASRQSSIDAANAKASESRAQSSQQATQMPNLIGHSIDEAQAYASKHGISIRTDGKDNQDGEHNIITRQVKEDTGYYFEYNN